jgi:hypothetical protein
MPEPAADSVILLDFDYIVKGALVANPELAARIFVAEPKGADTPQLQLELSHALRAMTSFPKATKVVVVVGGVRPYTAEYARARTKGLKGGSV